MRAPCLCLTLLAARAVLAAAGADAGTDAGISTGTDTWIAPSIEASEQGNIVVTVPKGASLMVRNFTT